MMYYKWIDPEKAQPGDYLFLKDEKRETIYTLYILFKKRYCNNIDANYWQYIDDLGEDYDAEIIDGKPTPELIARFASPSPRKEKWFEDIDGTTLIKTKLGILRISGINHRTEPLPGTKTGYIDYYYFFVHQYPAIEDIHERYTYNSKEKAETERARLIEWLEGA